MERYSRQTMLPDFGREGQRRLTQARVLTVGLGGLGTPVATYLTGAGVGTIGLCDRDTVGLSNLQRQTLYSTEEIGQPKTSCAFRRLSRLNPEITFRIHPEGLTEVNASDIICNYDLVMDCTDNFASRYLIDEACFQAGVPWVFGAIGEFSGQVSVMNFGENPRRLTDLYPDKDEMLAIPEKTPGVIGAVPGAIGAIQACEAIKILSGAGTPLSRQLLTIDLLTNQFQTFDFQDHTRQ